MASINLLMEIHHLKNEQRNEVSCLHKANLSRGRRQKTYKYYFRYEYSKENKVGPKESKKDPCRGRVKRGLKIQTVVSEPLT